MDVHLTYFCQMSLIHDFFIFTNKKGKIMLYYYELCFFHDEDDFLADEKRRCSYCIKTEIAPVISDQTVLQILFGENPSEYEKELIQNLTCVMEISETEAVNYFDVQDFTQKVSKNFGTYYTRKTDCSSHN